MIGTQNAGLANGMKDSNLWSGGLVVTHAQLINPSRRLHGLPIDEFSLREVLPLPCEVQKCLVVDWNHLGVGTSSSKFYNTNQGTY